MIYLYYSISYMVYKHHSHNGGSLISLPQAPMSGGGAPGAPGGALAPPLCQLHGGSHGPLVIWLVVDLHP